MDSGLAEAEKCRLVTAPRSADSYNSQNECLDNRQEFMTESSRRVMMFAQVMSYIDVIASTLHDRVSLQDAFALSVIVVSGSVLSLPGIHGDSLNNCEQKGCAEPE